MEGCRATGLASISGLMRSDRHKLSLYYRVVRIIAAMMIVTIIPFIILVARIPASNTDPVIKWAMLAILTLLLILSVLMFRSPSRNS